MAWLLAHMRLRHSRKGPWRSGDRRLADIIALLAKLNKLRQTYANESPLFVKWTRHYTRLPHSWIRQRLRGVPSRTRADIKQGTSQRGIGPSERHFLRDLLSSWKPSPRIPDNGTNRESTANAARLASVYYHWVVGLTGKTRGLAVLTLHVMTRRLVDRPE